LKVIWIHKEKHVSRHVSFLKTICPHWNARTQWTILPINFILIQRQSHMSIKGVSTKDIPFFCEFLGYLPTLVRSCPILTYILRLLNYKVKPYVFFFFMVIEILLSRTTLFYHIYKGIYLSLQSQLPNCSVVECWSHSLMNTQSVIVHWNLIYWSILTKQGESVPTFILL